MGRVVPLEANAQPDPATHLASGASGCQCKWPSRTGRQEPKINRLIKDEISKNSQLDRPDYIGSAVLFHPKVDEDKRCDPAALVDAREMADQSIIIGGGYESR